MPLSHSKWTSGMLIVENVNLCLNNHGICDKIYLSKSLFVQDLLQNLHRVMV